MRKSEFRHADCPAWCVGDSHAEDTAVDHFHDGRPVHVGDGEHALVLYLSAMTSDDGDDVTGLAIAPAARPDEGYFYTRDEAQELADKVQRLLAQAHS